MKVRKEDLFRSHGTYILFCSGPSIYEHRKSTKNNANLKVSPSGSSQKQGDEQGTCDLVARISCRRPKCNERS